jgi:hypothetical protein
VESSEPGGLDQLEALPASMQDSHASYSSPSNLVKYIHISPKGINQCKE